jgi:LacI family transcriptional regulator
MTHRFPIKEIAAQAGLSTATVDRVINMRPNVSAQTKGRVNAALKELERQEGQLAARGRRLFIDIVVEAPRRFSQKIRDATEAILPNVTPAVIRPRFTFQEVMTEAETLAHLTRIAQRGSQGVCLKARDLPAIRAAVAMLTAKGIPVVTMFTDISTARLAYVGLDNAQAGRTAAYLMGIALRGQTGTILLTQSHDAFEGEEAREQAFRAALPKHLPQMTLIEMSGGAGLATLTASQISTLAPQLRELRGVYSMGGGNRAILAALQAIKCGPQIYIGHDLDTENRALLRRGQIHFLLEHDLTRDMARAFGTITAQHRLNAIPSEPELADVQILTPAHFA